MRISYSRCDACRSKIGEGHKERDGAFSVRSSWHEDDLDLCWSCWSKMCAAVGITPDTNQEPSRIALLRGISRDPSSGMLAPGTAEEWRVLLDDAGLRNVEVPVGPARERP